jgi:hypothetical protein
MTEQKYIRRVIKITAEHSPNVVHARKQLQQGLIPTNEVIIPNVLTWEEYQHRLKLWDVVRQTIGLNACWYAGAEVLLYPPEWLDRAERFAVEGFRQQRNTGKGMGVDTAQGGDNTAWCVIDELGILDLVSKSTSDTSTIIGDTMALMQRWAVPPEKVCFDAGGGGKQHVDWLRSKGHKVRSVAFGEAVMPEIKRGMRKIEERKDIREQRYAYFNRRAQLYGEFSIRLDPGMFMDEHGNESRNYSPFGIPAGIMGNKSFPRSELRHQLAVVPKLYDENGRLRMLPKNKPRKVSDSFNPDEDGGGRDTLIGLIGHSPDEMDALVLAYHAMTKRATVQQAGGF